MRAVSDRVRQVYPLVSTANLPAYAAILIAWALCSTILAIALISLGARVLTWPTALWSTSVCVLTGMGVMFVASALNLRRLRAGFERLARGEREPGIPPVWCPVLTMATRAAIELADGVEGR